MIGPHTHIDCIPIMLIMGKNIYVDDDNVYHDDNANDDDDGLPAHSHQSYSHQVGICHNDEGWEYDRVTFPPYINQSYTH